MKKLLLTLGIGILSVAQANAQYDEYAFISVGPEAGLQLSTLREQVAGEVRTGELNSGLRFGAIVKVRISDRVSFQSGAYYSRKGYETSYDLTSVMGERVYNEREYTRASIRYLEIPLTLQYKLTQGETGHLFAGAGPYAAIVTGGNIYGSSRRSVSTDNISSSIQQRSKRDLEVGDKPEIHDIESGDAGVTANLGYMWKSGVLVRSHADFGIANLKPGGTQNNSFRNFSFGITVGYLIGL